MCSLFNFNDLIFLWQNISLTGTAKIEQPNGCIWVDYVSSVLIVFVQLILTSPNQLQNTGVMATLATVCTVEDRVVSECYAVLLIAKVTHIREQVLDPADEFMW